MKDMWNDLKTDCYPSASLTGEPHELMRSDLLLVCTSDGDYHLAYYECWYINGEDCDGWYNPESAGWIDNVEYWMKFERPKFIN